MREKKEEERWDMQAGRRWLKEMKKSPFSGKLQAQPLPLSLSLSLPHFFLPSFFQFCSRPLGHTLESSRKDPINVKYQAERQKDSRW